VEEGREISWGFGGRTMGMAVGTDVGVQAQFPPTEVGHVVSAMITSCSPFKEAANLRCGPVIVGIGSRVLMLT